LARVERFEEALEAYRELVAEHPRVATAWYQLGRLLQERFQRPTEAIAALTEAIAIEPRAARFHYHMGLSLERLERIPEATVAYERALRHDRGLVDAYRGLIRILEQSRQWDRGRDLATQWLETVPSAEAARALGTCLMMLNQFGDAKDALLKAHEFDPQSPNIIADLASVMGECGESAQAEALLRRALWSRPDSEMLLEALAYVLLRAERCSEALEVANAAIKVMPTAGDTHAAAAAVLLQMRQPAEALKEFDLALQLSPSLVELHANRGVALNLLGRHREAVAEFELVTDVDPAFFRRWEDHPLLAYYEAAKRGQIAEVDVTANRERAARTVRPS
jgi:tetratricopeptide (TPR) repeat protein